ncbi:MAG: chromosomal replication initiator protein DnaA [Anaerolineales bacterium]|nr:chromosomal replication initiator protein DnaA [Anaerolineales bacterium]
MQPDQVWQAALGQLQMEIPKSTFDTWVRGTALVAQEEDAYVVGVNNAYAKDWLENRLQGTVKRTLTNLVGRSVDVHFVVAPASSAPAPNSMGTDPGDQAPEGASGARLAALSSSTLNPKYKFESFVVGPSNRLAHAACMAAAENPAKAYNPLFVYGGVGLGKTHLLQAVGNACRARGLAVLYVSSEEFTNDLINAIRNHTTEDFRDKYRSIDVLLIDDIQFIAGKESTQEEFFHTFNTLHGQDKQLVMTSDRPPKAMVTLEERLRSRFEWGLTVDIQPPDLETRQAILRTKAERARRQVDDAVIELIARRVQSNIRELEGALTRVLAYADLIGQPLTMDLATSALADLLPRHRTLAAPQIIDTVAGFYTVTSAALLGPDRTKEVALARQVAMYLLREETEASLPAIGEALGGRDHTTIMYGCRKIADMIERDDSLRRQVISLRERLYSQVGVPA